MQNFSRYLLEKLSNLSHHHQQQLLLIHRRCRHYWRNMECEALKPPAKVRGMRVLDRAAFCCKVQVPQIRLQEHQVHKVLPLLKKLLLKMERLRPVRECSEEYDKNAGILKEILLHPLPVQSWDSLPTSELAKIDITASNFFLRDIELNYENWRADEIFKSVLPEEDEGLSSYSRIGHIVHLNLRDHLMPYKALIGQVLLDKVPGCRTVVNKSATIDSTYRNFQMELLCGEEDYKVETKECGTIFEFDFSQVYWNPRLSTEHERITKMLQPGDVLYDVFAGVGPFSVPAAKKRCVVLANDLNPESFRWLQHNAKRNKCEKHIKCYNKGGRAFILEDVKEDLLKRWGECSLEEQPTNAIHITMNLPALAVEFIDAFRGLFKKEAESLNFKSEKFNYPVVHVYSFAKGEDTKQLVRELVEAHLGLPLGDNLQDISFVRNVAPNKDMYRVSFRLTEEILTKPKENVADEVTGGQNNRKRASETSENEKDEENQSAKVKCT